MFAMMATDDANKYNTKRKIGRIKQQQVHSSEQDIELRDLKGFNEIEL